MPKQLKNNQYIFLSRDQEIKQWQSNRAELLLKAHMNSLQSMCIVLLDNSGLFIPGGGVALDEGIWQGLEGD
jgi:hypothetical protein